MHRNVKARKTISSGSLLTAVQFSYLLIYHTPVTHWEPVPGLDAKARDGNLAESTGTSRLLPDEIRRQPGTQSVLKVILCSYSILFPATYQ